MYTTVHKKCINLINVVCISFVGLKFLRKQAYSNILKNLQPRKENFQIKNLDVFHISAQNIHCGYS